MDVRTALIAGTAFAGVLIAGAVAAPRGGGDAGTGDAQQSVATISGGQSPTDTLVTLPAANTYVERDGRRESHDDDHHGDDHEEDDD